MVKPASAASIVPLSETVVWLLCRAANVIASEGNGTGVRALSIENVSPAARSVLMLTSKVVSQYCPGHVPQGLRNSSSPVLLS